MRILKSSEHWFQTNGVITKDNQRSNFLKTVAKNIMIVLIMGPLGTSSPGLYIYHHLNELEKSTTALMMFCAFPMSCVKYLSLRRKNEEIKQLISDFRKLYISGMQILLTRVVVQFSPFWTQLLLASSRVREASVRKGWYHWT